MFLSNCIKRFCPNDFHFPRISNPHVTEEHGLGPSKHWISISPSTVTGPRKDLSRASGNLVLEVVPGLRKTQFSLYFFAKQGSWKSGDTHTIFHARWKALVCNTEDEVNIRMKETSWEIYQEKWPTHMRWDSPPAFHEWMNLFFTLIKIFDIHNQTPLEYIFLISTLLLRDLHMNWFMWHSSTIIFWLYCLHDPKSQSTSNTIGPLSLLKTATLWRAIL